MAFTATGTPGDLTLGNYLKIVSKGAVYNNLSEDSPIWDLIKKQKKGDAEGRQLRFLLRSAYGAGAAGFVAVDGGAYPTASQATISEGTAEYKDFALTVEVERTLVAKALSDFSRYGEPLAEELRSKSIALSRQLSRAAYGDGTGYIGEISGTPSITAGTMTITLATADTSYGHVGYFELGDKIDIYSTDGAGRDPTATGTHSHYLVAAKSRENNTIDVTGVNTLGAASNITAVNDVASGDLIARLSSGGADTAIDVNPSSGITDYGKASYEYAGLESLSQNDGRVVNGVTLSGALAGTRRDASGNPIDSQDFQQLMSQVMIAVGQGRYKYNKAMMSWETLDALIESREVDRRFNSIEDNKRGVSSLGYQHGKNGVIFEADEFCPKKRIYVCPDADVLQFHGSDFDFVKPDGGSKFFLTPNSSADGHKRSIRSYMEGSGVLVSNHSAAIGCIHNFTS
jgi:hypothetical protein